MDSGVLSLDLSRLQSRGPAGAAPLRPEHLRTGGGGPHGGRLDAWFVGFRIRLPASDQGVCAADRVAPVDLADLSLLVEPIPRWQAPGYKGP